MKREVHTRGIVLGRRAAGEGSSRISFYTEDLGLIVAVATSGREERSKLRAHLVAGTYGTYSLVKGKRDWRLTGAVKTQNIFYTCVTDEQRQSVARIVAMVKQFVRGEGVDTDLFVALSQFIEAAPTLSGADTVVAEYVAALNILSALGYIAPEPVKDFLGAQYSAALLTQATQKKRDLVRAINDGISISGL